MAPEFIAATKRANARPQVDGAAFARYYDLDVADERDDIDMYLAMASASDGPVLELACGTGRVAVPVAAAGHRVTGVDFDPYMLDRARAAWHESTKTQAARRDAGSLELVLGNITTLRLDRQFDLVILAFNSLLLLAGDKERAAGMATIREHLAPDGRAVLDIRQPTTDDLELYDGRVIEDWSKNDPETGELATKSTVATYDAAARRATIRTRYDITRDSVPVHRLERSDEIAFVSRDELIAEMDAAGLAVQSEIEAEGNRVTVIAALSVHPFHTSRTN